MARAAAQEGGYLLARSSYAAETVPTLPLDLATRLQHLYRMRTAVLPEAGVEPELRADLESVLREGETLSPASCAQSCPPILSSASLGHGKLAHRLPMKLVHSIAAAFFAVLGIATLLGAGAGFGF